MHKERENLQKLIKPCEVKEQSPKSVRDWVDFMQKNKPQTNALSAGIMLVIYGGQNVGWGIFNNHLDVQPWAAGYVEKGTIFWTILVWFIGQAVGLLIGCLISNRYSKMKIYTLASILSATSATLLIVGSTNTFLIILSRIIGGISYGATYICVLIHASEVAVTKLRGMIVSTINFCFFIGIFMTSSSLVAVYKTRSYDVDPTKTIGYNGLICILTGIVLALFLNRESPVFLIKKYREAEALETMIKLRSESHETATIKNEFNEFRLMIQEDSQSSMNILRYWYSVIVVLLLKYLFVCSFNMPLNNYFLESVKSHFYNSDTDTSGIFLSGARWIAMILPMFLIDFLRTKLFFISSIGSGIILLFIALEPFPNESMFSLCLILLFQIFAGLSIGLIPDIFSVDSVNTKIKPYFIAITSIAELILQIFFIVSNFYLSISITFLLVLLGFSLIICGIITYPFTPYFNFLPDTSGLSLRVARNKFL